MIYLSHFRKRSRLFMRGLCDSGKKLVLAKPAPLNLCGEHSSEISGPITSLPITTVASVAPPHQPSSLLLASTLTLPTFLSLRTRTTKKEIENGCLNNGLAGGDEAVQTAYGIQGSVLCVRLVSCSWFRVFGVGCEAD